MMRVGSGAFNEALASGGSYDRDFIDNPASGRVLEKLGFAILNTSERQCLATGGAKLSIEVGYPEAEQM